MKPRTVALARRRGSPLSGSGAPTSLSGSSVFSTRLVAILLTTRDASPALAHQTTKSHTTRRGPGLVLDRRAKIDEAADPLDDGITPSREGLARQDPASPASTP